MNGPTHFPAARARTALPVPRPSTHSGRFAPECSPRDPRNPQQHSKTGQAKDAEAKGILMNIFSPVRPFLFALIILTMSAASLGEVGITISFGPPALPVCE